MALGLPFPISRLILISYFFTTRLTVEPDFCKVGDLPPPADPPARVQAAELVADGNVVHTTDFRRVYASLIEGWFGYRDSRALLSGDFATLAMFSG